MQKFFLTVNIPCIQPVGYFHHIQVGVVIGYYPSHKSKNKERRLEMFMKKDSTLSKQAC